MYFKLRQTFQIVSVEDVDVWYRENKTKKMDGISLLDSVVILVNLRMT